MTKVVCRVVASVVLMGFLTVNTACYGPFALTKNVYQWNSNVKGSGQISDKWMKELVFFGMLVVPAYMFSALLDTFIFNSMHFWTGESPIKSSDVDGRTKTVMVGDTTLRWTPSEDGAVVTYERYGVVDRRAMIVTSANGYRLIDENGKALSEAHYGDDGSVRLLGSDGRVVQHWSEAQLRSMARGHHARTSHAGN